MSQHPSHTGIFAYIQVNFNRKTMRMSKRFIEVSEQLARHYQYLALNTRCHRCAVIPNYLRVRPLVRTMRGRKLAEKFSRQPLSAQIGACHQNIRRLKRKESELATDLKEILPQEICETLMALKEKVFRDVTATCKDKQKSKFDKLLQDCSPTSCFTGVEERWIVNF